MKFHHATNSYFLSALFGAFLLLSPAALNPSFANAFVRGDCNANGSIDIDDAMLLFNYSLYGEPAPCHSAMDVDGNSKINLVDTISLLSFLFSQASPPAAPFPNCGFVAIPDGLGCASFDGCSPSNTSRLLFANTKIESLNTNPKNHLALLNSDAYPDLVHTNRSDGTISVYLNNGHSNFTNSQEYNVGMHPDDIDSADMNGDGHIDLIICNINSETVTVLFGNAQGQFSSSTVIPVGTYPRKAEAHDMNQDGLLDIVTLNFFGEDISIALGLGNQLFAPAISNAIGYLPSDFKIGHINQDSFPDIIVFSESFGSVNVYKGIGNGQVQHAQSYSLPTNYVLYKLVDFNGDQILDLLFGRYNVFVMLGVGDASFASPQLVMTSPEGIFREYDLADLNQDGYMDVVTFNSNHTISLILQNAAGVFNTVATFDSTIDNAMGNFSIKMHDIDLDSKLDLLVTSQRSTLIWPGYNLNYFLRNTEFDLTGNLDLLHQSDFNNDGRPDFAYTHSSSTTLKIQMSNGHLSFNSTSTIPLLSPAAHLTSRDINNDGNIDIIASSEGSVRISFYLGNGDGSFQSPIELHNVDGAVAYTEVADFNQDGNIDLVYAEANQNRIALRLGLGNGQFGSAIYIPTTQDLQTVKARDLNHDGILDLITTEAASEEIGVFLGISTTEFSAPIFSPLANSPRQFELADFNCDGQLDIVVSTGISFDDRTGFALAFGNGDGSFAESQQQDIGESTSQPIVVDIDGDGYQDILMSRSDVNQIHLYYNDGTGQFHNPSVVQLRTDSNSDVISLHPADYDVDGDIDLLSINYDIGGLTLSLSRLVP